MFFIIRVKIILIYCFHILISICFDISLQADDLRLDMARLEKEHSRREDLLRQEIAHLQEVTWHC